ncbi:uncharacterized protein At1g76070-like [Cryptomeria japonica]|uniref:uncharacterized protein At1g76070-like n=1 Tax=Cryptomeria japonica TaxID=3369 RepID=UPI0027DA55B4|nr:uncharacterized protein At1g76070-like [Cryptomeria japonica]
MEVNHRGNKQEKKFDDLEPPSPISKVFSCISKAASMKSYAIAPFSPEYSFRVKSIGSRGHSGPIIPIIPKEALRSKRGGGLESQEPGSPKVSCIGQVKLKAKGSRNLNCKDKGGSRVRPPLTLKELGRMVKVSRLFLGKMQTEKAVSVSVSAQLPKDEGNECSSVGQMKRFASRRESPALANFYAHSQDLVNEKDECGAFSEDDEVCEVNLSSVIAELKSRTNSEIRLWERSHVEFSQTPSAEGR